ncbi:TetR/AcrR family transcriptional regulator, partial [Rhizorhabdus dicambivorans]|uniref:HTH tetR-type domain-containing protein n=1 Tax=Rhizorhabdus dicambivorans TaxID=1850238 RepID=A0A2A4FN64_9SPHN|nr:hypothetical protein COO09_24975 [Rhizorhabdus dicambivorans]
MILAIATSSFLAKGYFATTMSSIATEIGGSKATLWTYFSSKGDLFSAVIDSLNIEYRAHIATLLERLDDPERTLHKFCISFLEII